MQKRRTPGEPWHTALYREPHTMWWAPPLFVLAAVFIIWRFVFGDDSGEALVWALVSSCVYGVVAFLGWRRSRG